MRIGFFGHHEQIIQFFSNLRLVRQSQGIVGCTASRYVVYHGVFNADFGYIHLHGGFHDSSARLIVLGLYLTLVWVGGLSGTSSEDRAVVPIIINIHADGILYVIVLQRKTERFGCGRSFIGFGFISSTIFSIEYHIVSYSITFYSMIKTKN